MKRLTPGLARLIGPLLILLVFSVACAAGPAQDSPRTFPETIGGFRLQKVVVREAAKKDLSSIHEGRINVAQAAIAHYQGPTGGAVVWWSRHVSEADAQDQLDRMVAKIQRGGFGYGGYRRLERAGLTVHAFAGGGMGGLHYTFRRGPETWWIAASPADIEAILSALIR